jgi:glyoxylase-like metal-dependent hydrolase (beta-lactamase superfamily II)
MTAKDVLQRRKVGAIEVTSVSDGVFKTSLDVFLGIERAEGERLLGAAGANELQLSVNSFLFNLDGKWALTDAGTGPTMGPELGHLPDNLRATGVAPEAIDYVLLTHMHPDHSNGLVDAAGKPYFPNAQLIMHEEEARFWLEREEKPSDPERLRRNTEAARRVTASYRARMRTVRDGEVLPGLSAVLQAGHTPGHTAWLLQSQGDRLLIWGDIVHMAAIQVPRPDAALVFDVDPEAARAARRRTFEWAVQERLRVAGAHLPAPGFSYLQRDGDGYRLEADA